MGIKNLGLIASELIKYGKNPDTPAAVIEKGTTGNQKVITGVSWYYKISDTEEKGISCLASCYCNRRCGNKREKFAGLKKKGFLEKIFLVTRDEGTRRKFLQEKLKRGRKFRTSIFFKNLGQMQGFDYSKLKDYKAVLFNSPNGVRFFFEHIPDIRFLGDIKIGAVGAKTKEELQKFKITADVMPEKYLVEELAKDILKITEEGDKLLVITSDISPFDDEE